MDSYKCIYVIKHYFNLIENYLLNIRCVLHTVDNSLSIISIPDITFCNNKVRMYINKKFLNKLILFPYLIKTFSFFKQYLIKYYEQPEIINTNELTNFFINSTF